MNPAARAAVFGFAADPRALADLRKAPPHIRNLALLHLHDLVHGEQRGAQLGQRAGVDLTGYRRLYIDPHATWRIVYQERPAPPGSHPDREVFLIAVGPREGHEAYNTAARRLGRLDGPASADRTSAARSITSRPHHSTPTPPPSSPPPARTRRSR